MRSFLFIILVLAASVANGQTYTGDSNLYQIEVNGRYGFINNKGKEIIKPVFRNDVQFSEGLASARINGKYGFIDKKGKFVIPQKFDYANNFTEGLALVYIDGKPLFINKKGKCSFPVNYSGANSFQNGRALVKTKSGKKGMIDNKGVLVVDTIFRYIDEFSCGRAIVMPFVDKSNQNEYEEYGVIDSNGKFIVPFGKYNAILKFNSGYANVEKKDSNGIIDLNGKQLCLFNDTDIYIHGDVCEGLATVINTKKNASWRQGYINLLGQIVLKDSSYDELGNFTKGRAFVQLKNNQYLLINKQGKVLSKDTLSYASDFGFKYGPASIIKKVGTNSFWGTIDTDGNYVVQPIYNSPLQFPNTYQNISIFYVLDSIVNTPALQGPFGHYGIKNKTGDTIINYIGHFEIINFPNGLAKLWLKDRICFLDKDGKIVWNRVSDKKQRVENLNTDEMKRGDFSTYSGYRLKKFSIKYDLKKHIYPENKLSIIVVPKEKDTFNKEEKYFTWYNGFKVYVVNNSNDTVRFNTLNSLFLIKMQAFDKNGQWKDIEYILKKGEGCYNRYEIYPLEPGYFWSFTAPDYDGAYKTKLRFTLTYIDPSDISQKEGERKGINIYSNEFKGKINPAQFWRNTHPPLPCNNYY